MGKFEEEFFDVLHGIEQAIYNGDQQLSGLADFNVVNVLDGLIRLYIAEERARREPQLKFSSHEQSLAERVKQTCELNLGRDPAIPLGDVALNVTEMIACLKRIRRSVDQMGGKGRRGYLEFISEFFSE